MEAILAITIGLLFGAGVFCLLRRNVSRLIIGIMLLSQAANLLVFTAGGLTEGSAAFVPAGLKEPVPPYADPLPQALVLTAIVIGFGLVCFSIVLLQRASRAVGSDDLDLFRQTDRLS